MERSRIGRDQVRERDFAFTRPLRQEHLALRICENPPPPAVQRIGRAVGREQDRPTRPVAVLDTRHLSPAAVEDSASTKTAGDGAAATLAHLP